MHLKKQTWGKLLKFKMNHGDDLWKEALKQALTILIDGMGRHPLHIIEIPLHYLRGKEIKKYIYQNKISLKGF